MFIQTTTKYRAKKLCPFTPDIIATVCGGFMCFESKTNYLTWRKQK